MIKEFRTELLESTKELVEFLNKEVMSSDWKRTNKFKIEEKIVRTFKDSSGKVITIVSDNAHNYTDQIILEDIELDNDLIKRIMKSLTYVYTYDYGDVCLNPVTMELNISGGDNGVYVFPKKKFKDSDEREDFIQQDRTTHKDITKLILLAIPELKKVEIEAEWSPDIDDGFISIGTLKLIDE